MSKRRTRLDYEKIARELGASRVRDKNGIGLEVILSTPLDIKRYRVGPFPLECLDGYDLSKGMVKLSKDYKVSLDSETFFFRSSAPDRPTIFIHKSKVVSIKRLSDNRVLYQQ